MVRAKLETQINRFQQDLQCKFFAFLISVPSENKKDQRSIEQTMADIQAKKKLKTQHQEI